MALGLAGGWACTSAPSHPTGTLRCSESVQATVSPQKPTVTVSYTEPSVNVAGNKLQGLAKTTIYYDLGAGRILAKEVPSTNPAGGGQVSEVISVPVPQPREIVVRICVTATDRHGNESAMTP